MARRLVNNFGMALEHANPSANGGGNAGVPLQVVAGASRTAEMQFFYSLQVQWICAWREAPLAAELACRGADFALDKSLTAVACTHLASP